jgi:hypothetical protein
MTERSKAKRTGPLRQAGSSRSPVAVLAMTGSLAFACSTGSGGADNGVDTGPPCIEPDTGLPADLFCTGLYADRKLSRINGGAMPYTPGVTLWSDGAEKHRYLYLPPSTTIDTSNLDAWRFPVGTKAWKEFRVDGGR